MCGIVGAVANSAVTSVLLEGLSRLEYRGYDSSGIAILDSSGSLQRIRSVGKVSQLQNLLDRSPLQGSIGIAHTRWATHGMLAERNAHPHMSGERVAVVHNGIIENHAELRNQLESKGFCFTSDTDTEVIVHLLVSMLDDGDDLLIAVRNTLHQLVGAYALAVLSPDDPDRLVIARAGSPLVVGISDEGNFVASDVFALLPVTRNFMFLEEGGIAEIRHGDVTVFDCNGKEGTSKKRKLGIPVVMDRI
ncbi:MAG: class II glutamine amidotransferase [Sedimenticola sp.]